MPAFKPERVELELVVVKITRAYGWECSDKRACNRRRAAGRQLNLFGAA